VTGRGVVAIAVLTAWGAGIAAYAQHELARTPRERMAEIAARVAPGATYFAVERSGAHVGFASSTIDTVPGGLQVTDYLVADLAAEGGSRRTTAQSTVHLSRGLGLRDFTIVYGTASQRLRASGHTMGDTLLEYVVSTTEDGRAALTAGDSTPAGDTTRVRLTGPLLLPTLVPLVALGEPPEVGQRHTMETFDPMTMSVRSLALTIRAESLFVVVDSAAFDTHSRRWLGAHADTVRGFRIVADDSATFDSWVDPLGRVITVHGPARLSLRRTAFEVAFENRRAAGKQRPAADAAPTTRSGRSRPRSRRGCSATQGTWICCSCASGAWMYRASPSTGAGSGRMVTPSPSPHFLRSACARQPPRCRSLAPCRSSTPASCARSRCSRWRTPPSRRWPGDCGA
jgi:hypothetical protein